MVKVKDLLYIDSAGNTSSSIPSGDINLSSLVQDEAFWLSPYKQSDKAKKTLILYSWFHSVEIFKLYYELKEEGFDIYFCNKDGQFSKDYVNLAELGIYRLKNPESIAIEFIKKMPHLNLTRDEVQVLDYKLLSNLLDDPNKEYPEICEIYTSKIEDLENDILKIYEYEASINQAVKIIYDYSNHPMGVLKKRLEKKGLEFEVSEKRLTIIHSNNSPISLESIVPPSAESLKIITPDSTHSFEGDFDIPLKVTPSYILDHYYDEALFLVTPELEVLPKLKELKFEQANIDKELSETLLKPSIKSIELVVSKFFEDFNSVEFSLTNLEEFYCHSPGITDTNLDHILSNTGPNLICLGIDKVLNSGDQMEGSYNLSKLKQLALGFHIPHFDHNQELMNPSLVSKILKSSSNSLNALLIGPGVDISQIEINDLSFNELTGIHVNSKIDMSGLKKIRKLLELNADNIKYINLDGTGEEISDLDISDLKFPKLNTIQVASESLFYRLMEKVGDNLEVLCITSEVIKDIELLKKFNFKKLQKLSISGKNCSIESLEYIINQAKDNLISLDLTGISFDKDQEYSGGMLTELEKIRVSDASSINEFLNSIIASASQQIRNINLHNLEGFTLKTTDLPKLTHISASNILNDQDDILELLYSCQENLTDARLPWRAYNLDSLKEFEMPNLISLSLHHNNSIVTIDDISSIDEHYSHFTFRPIDIGAPDLGTPLINLNAADNPFFGGKVNSLVPHYTKACFYTMDDNPYRNVLMTHARLHPYDYASKSSDLSDISSAFFMTNFENEQIEECSLDRGKLEEFIPHQSKSYVKVLLDEFSVSGEYKFLPSLSRREKIALLEIDEDVEFQYDYYHGFYKIRLKSGECRNVSIKYILEVPDDLSQEFNDAKNHHPKEVQDLIDELNAFTGEELQGIAEGEKKTTQEWVDLFCSQKVGRCAHRAFIFKSKLDKMLTSTYGQKYEVNLISNGLHAFCEYRKNPKYSSDAEDTKWKSVELGGVGSEIKVLENKLAQEIAHDSKEKSKDEKKYARKKEVKQKDPPVSISLEEIYRDMKESGSSKYLLKLEGSNSLKEAANSISLISLLCDDEIFKVKLSKDLICSKPVISKDECYESDIQTGKVDSIGSPFYNFIQNAKQDKSGKKFVVTIDFSNFSPSEIVRYNSIFDESPSIDGIAIPDNVVIFALSNTCSVNYYDGFDFTRRFDKQNIHDNVKVKPLRKVDFVEDAKDADSADIINLYEQSNWKDILFGKWIIQKGKIIHTEGSLTSELKKGGSEFHIKNAVWDQAFIDFWRESVNDGYFIHDGMKYDLPPNFKIIKSEGYDFSRSKDFIEFRAGFDASLETINPSYVYKLFDGYRPNPSIQSMEIQAGLIEQNTGGTLWVNLTRKLENSIWSRILDDCIKYNTKLQFFCESEDVLPEFFDSEMKFQESKSSEDIIIHSTDPGRDSALIKFTDNAITIDISEVSAADIIGTIGGRYIHEEKRFVFEENTGFLAKTLASGKNIILKGNNLSSEIKDVLSKILIARYVESSTIDSKLIIVTDNITGLEGAQIKESEFKSGELSFAQEKAIALFGENSFDITLKEDQERDELDFTKTKQLTEQFQKAREKILDNILENNPYVWLYGEAGVGKTKFVSDYAIEFKEGILHEGYESIENWARDKSSKPKFLFIDEANLKKTDYTIFESMFSFYNSKPVILLGNEIIELNDHKVIFAGNPITHGNHRNIPKLLDEHGGAVTFHSLPMFFIYENILKNIFNGEYEKLGQDITMKLDDIYDFFNHNIKSGDSPLTPREISQLALIAYNKSITGDDYNLFKLAYRYYGAKLSIISQDSYKQKFNLSEGQDITTSPFLREKFESIEYEDSKGEAKCYEIVPTRQDIYSIIEDLLLLRNLRMDSGNHDSELQWACKAGQFGMILEGEPKTGKSEIFRAILSKQGLKEGKDLLYIPVSMQNNAKRKLLLEAMKEGKIAMIDELNSVSLDEEFMNQILDGKEKHPGFTILATQNSASSMKGRFKIPEALSSRMIKQEMPDYTKAELRHIFGFEESDIQIDELCLAIYHNIFDNESLEALIKYASDQNIINDRNQFNQTAIEVAKEAGNIDAIIMLAKHNAELTRDIVEYISGQACRCIWEHDLHAEALIEFADPEWHNEYGQTIGDVQKSLAI